MVIETEGLGTILTDMKEKREGKEAQVAIGHGRGVAVEMEATLIPTEIGMMMFDIVRGKVMNTVTIEGVTIIKMTVVIEMGLFQMIVTGDRRDHMEKMNGRRESMGGIEITGDTMKKVE